MRDRAHYIDMLDRNPNATIGISLAVKMIRSVPGEDRSNEYNDEYRATYDRLRRAYGETMSNDEVRSEMGETRKG